MGKTKIGSHEHTSVFLQFRGCNICLLVVGIDTDYNAWKSECRQNHMLAMDVMTKDEHALSPFPTTRVCVRHAHRKPEKIASKSPYKYEYETNDTKYGIYILFIHYTIQHTYILLIGCLDFSFELQQSGFLCAEITLDLQMIVFNVLIFKKRNDSNTECVCVFIKVSKA